MKFSGISTVYVLVENIENAKKFYQDRLGLGKPVRETPNHVEWKVGKGTANFAIQKASDEELEGSIPARSTTRFHFQVDNVRKLYNDLFEKGVRLRCEPKEGTGYLYVDFMDVDGNMLRAVEYLK